MSRWYQNLELEDSIRPNSNISESNEANFDDLISQDYKEEAEGEDVEEVEGQETEETNIPEFHAYSDFISKSPAYQWLLENLNRQFLLAPAKPDLIEVIRRKIISSLPPSHKVSRKNASKAYKMIFEVDWDLLAFVKEQEYREEAHQAIGMAIVLTGSDKDAQALTCSQYLCQTWPSTGEQLMWLVKNVLRNGPDCPDTCKS